MNLLTAPRFLPTFLVKGSVLAGLTVLKSLSDNSKQAELSVHLEVDYEPNCFIQLPTATQSSPQSTYDLIVTYSAV